MTHATSRHASRYPLVSVSGSIRLGQFLKLAGLVEDGAEARIAIQSSDVTVNGTVETRRGHHLSDGDVIVVAHPAAGSAPSSSSWGPRGESGPQPLTTISNGLPAPIPVRLVGGVALRLLPAALAVHTALAVRGR